MQGAPGLSAGTCVTGLGFASVGKLTIRIPTFDRFYSGLRYPFYPDFITSTIHTMFLEVDLEFLMQGI